MDGERLDIGWTWAAAAESSTSSATTSWPRTSGQMLASGDTPSHSNPHIPGGPGRGEGCGRRGRAQRGSRLAGIGGLGLAQGHGGSSLAVPTHGVVVLILCLGVTAATDAFVTGRCGFLRWGLSYPQLCQGRCSSPGWGEPSTLW